MAAKKWIVTLSGERPVAEVRKELEKGGLKVDQAMEEIGVISGSCPAESAAGLRTVKGVADVSPDHAIDIGPPGSPDTW